jgi:hypothetical protein
MEVRVSTSTSSNNAVSGKIDCPIVGCIKDWTSGDSDSDGEGDSEVGFSVTPTAMLSYRPN